MSCSSINRDITKISRYIAIFFIFATDSSLHCVTDRSRGGGSENGINFSRAPQCLGAPLSFKNTNFYDARYVRYVEKGHDR